jgi:hypothetical protein
MKFHLITWYPNQCTYFGPGFTGRVHIITISVIIGEVWIRKIVPVLNSLSTTHEGVWGSGCIIHIFLTSARVRCEWSASRPWRLTPGIHSIGGWGAKSRSGPRGENSSLYQDSNSSVVQPVASRYTGSFGVSDLLNSYRPMTTSNYNHFTNSHT